MDKSWMKLGETNKGRLSKDYETGAIAFVEFAKGASDQEGNIKCPCKKCRNAYRFNHGIVLGHLIMHGIMQSYIFWCYHGEGQASTVRADHETEHDDDGDELLGIDALLEDRIRAEGRSSDEMHNPHKFEKIIMDAQCEVFPGCKNINLLEFVIHVMNLKVVNKWSNKSLDMLLGFLKKLLPKGNIVPKSTYEIKKILRDLGMEYMSIHACKNDCSLFWKETAKLDACPVCKESRYKNTPGNGKLIPHKVLRWLPLIPRLKNLFMSRDIAEQMKWHVRRTDTNDGFLRHPADGLEWKFFDKQHPEFASEPRNVRLGLATDGFNPFGNMSTTYSMWPVIVMPYNFPPWMGMKESFFMMPLLIPGPNAPGRDIDVYLRPLVDELKDLWENGVLNNTGTTTFIRQFFTQSNRK